ncbi:MAG: cob(I)yrinic acid a,c-diamide adenosyltransferase [Coprobacter sp.]|nr:cob(I)yrinic acid a,c-diamide adenosyltransferase [Coprobacter sp.]
MGKIYTRSGDEGTTGLCGGRRVDKDDIRIETNGTLDELNAVIGVVRSFMSPDDERQEILRHQQREIMKTMHCIATAPTERAQGVPLPDSRQCEKIIDSMIERCNDIDRFVLPAGTPIAAHLQLARTVARRAERRMWSLHRTERLPEAVMQYVNRLSDVLFVMAREEMSRQGNKEELWRYFRNPSHATE